MGLLHFDGFRSYADYADFNATVAENIASQEASSSYLDFGTSYSRFGGTDIGIRIKSSDKYLVYNIDPSLSPATVIVGLVFKQSQTGSPGANTSEPLVTIEDGSGNVHLRVCIDSDYNIKVYRSTTLLGTSSGKSVSPTAWQCLETKLFIDNSSGTVELKLDGTQILNLTAQDTLEGSNAYARLVRFRSIYNDLDTNFDCIWIMDNTGDSPQNDFLGDCRVDVIRPNGAGANADFTPSAGSNYENVDEATPDDDSTHNSSGTVGHQDSYALPSLSAGGTIFGVKSLICIAKDDAGAKGAKILTRSNSTYYKSDEINPPTDYKSFGKVYQNNPDDSLAWQESDIAGMEVGVEVSS